MSTIIKIVDPSDLGSKISATPNAKQSYLEPAVGCDHVDGGGLKGELHGEHQLAMVETTLKRQVTLFLEPCRLN